MNYVSMVPTVFLGLFSIVMAAKVYSSDHVWAEWDIQIGNGKIVSPCIVNVEAF
jgi:hypothetical protein